MPAAKQSEPRRHHYVPQFYLERFADTQRRLGAFDRQLEQTMKTSAKNVAVERDFYRLPDSTELPPRALEDLLSAQESAAAEAIRETADSGSVREAHREILAMHMVVQMRRTRQHRNFMKESAEYIGNLQAQVNLNQLLEEDEFEDEAERESAERYLAQFTSGELHVTADDKSLGGMILDRLEQLVPILLTGWNWIVVGINRPEFVTSDSPLCMLGEPAPGSPARGVGLETALEHWFPLDPKHALVLSRDHSLPSYIEDISNGHIRAINLRLALESERWTFFHPRNKSVHKFQLPREAPRFKEETLGHRERGDGMTGELVRLGVERPHVPNERLLSGRRLQSFPR